MVNRIEIEQLLQSKKMKELWQTIQQELPQLHFYEENDSWEEARIAYLQAYIDDDVSASEVKWKLADM